ncbi:kelch-like protein 12 isoform X2 [Cimex lectularius]|uniref:Kelch-like protein diablo n=1 Tax=Cimex lectularius TaxID=79782 RepID=A0A8I6TE96_CIMLE|nr:kelch-like protein 12 isoform X2 [Cimex lectularius]
MVYPRFILNGIREDTSARYLSVRREERQSSESESETQSDDLMEGPGSNEYKFVEASHSQQLLLGLNTLRKRGEFCDVTISVEGQKFPAHRNVLSAFSPYFKAMFLSHLVESRQNVVTLLGVEPEMVGLLLDYAYTSQIMITGTNVQALLSAANLLQVLPVKEASCRFLENHIDAGNCLGIHCFAEVHACIELQEKTKCYVLQNFCEVYKQEEFLNLSTCKLMELTSNDSLQVEREEIVFQALIRWYQHKPDQRKVDFPKLLENVRLALLSPYFLVDCVEGNPIVADNPECLKLIEEAKRYHLLPDRRHELATQRSKPRLTSDTIEVIVAVGGEDDKVVLRAVECYCTTTKTWKSLACLPFAISKHGLVASGKNTLYLAGGEFPDGGPSRSVWRYDPVLDYWQEMESMLVSRSELGLAMLDGFLYAVGGWEGANRLSSVERYDPSTNTWSLIAPMKMALTSAAVVAHDGLLYVTGGAILEEGDGIELVQRYDPRSNTWSEVSPLKIPRSGAAICALDNFIYVVGGWHASTDNTNRVECYNIKTDTWEFRSSMCEKRYRPGISVIDGKIYVLGGEEGWDKYHASIEVYNPETDTWTLSGEMLTSRSWLGCVPLQVRKSNCRDVP